MPLHWHLLVAVHVSHRCRQCQQGGCAQPPRAAMPRPEMSTSCLHFQFLKVSTSFESAGHASKEEVRRRAQPLQGGHQASSADDATLRTLLSYTRYVGELLAAFGDRAQQCFQDTQAPTDLLHVVRAAGMQAPLPVSFVYFPPCAAHCACCGATYCAVGDAARACVGTPFSPPWPPS